MSHFDLRGRTIVITGGTGGLARALAPLLVAREAKVALLDTDAEVAQQLAKTLGGKAVAWGWKADVRDYAELESVMKQVASHFGHIDVVMANAAVAGATTPLQDLDISIWERSVDINLNGVYRTFRAALPYVLQQNGYMLATSSMSAFIHAPLKGSYTAVKAATWALCDSWRLELKGSGVDVGSLHPTFFKSQLLDDMMNDPAGALIWDGNGNKGSFKLIPVEKVAEAALHGIENRSRHIFAPRSLRFVASNAILVQKFLEFTHFTSDHMRKVMAAVRK